MSIQRKTASGDVYDVDRVVKKEVVPLGGGVFRNYLYPIWLVQNAEGEYIHVFKGRETIGIYGYHPITYQDYIELVDVAIYRKSSPYKKDSADLDYTVNDTYYNIPEVYYGDVIAIEIFDLYKNGVSLTTDISNATTYGEWTIDKKLTTNDRLAFYTTKKGYTFNNSSYGYENLYMDLDISLEATRYYFNSQPTIVTQDGYSVRGSAKNECDMYISGDAYDSSNSCYYTIMNEKIIVDITIPEGCTLPEQYLFNDSSNSKYLLHEGRNEITFTGVKGVYPMYYMELLPTAKRLKQTIQINFTECSITVDQELYDLGLDVNSTSNFNFKITSLLNINSPYTSSPRNLKPGDILYYGDQISLYIYMPNNDYYNIDKLILQNGEEITEYESRYIDISQFVVKGDIKISVVTSAKYTTVSEINYSGSTNNLGAQLHINRVSSPYGKASTGALSVGDKIYMGDVIEVYYSVPSGVQALIDKGGISYEGYYYSNSDYTKKDITQTPTQYTVTQVSWAHKYTLKSNTYSNLIYSNDAWDAGTAMAWLTFTRISSLAGESTGQLEEGTAVFPGDVIQITTGTTSGFQILQIEGPINDGEWANVTQEGYLYTVTGLEDSSNWIYFYFYADDFSTNGFTMSGTTITKYSFSASSLTIPDRYYTVKRFDGSTFHTLTNKDSAEAFEALVGETLIDTIGANAFQGNSYLTSVTIPSSVKWIKDYAFENCTKLATVTMSAYPTSIGSYAFSKTAISTLSYYMYECSSLGTGCFASNNSWGVNIGDSAEASRLVATNSSSGGTYKSVYGGVILGGGAQKTGGNNGTSGSGTINFRVGNYTGSFTVNYNQNYTIAYPNYRVQTQTTNLTIGMTSKSGNFSNDSGSGGVYMGTSMNDRSNSSASESLTAGTLKKRYLNWGIITTCLTEHTMLTLTNGSRKRADQITYKDLLLCYNFETGKQDYQYPLAITKGETQNHFTRIHLDNGLYIDICGQHDIYDPKAHIFRTYGDGHILSTGLKDYYILDDSGQVVKIKHIERIEREVTSYCIITSGTITAYADTAMVGMSHMNFGRIDSTNKFSKEFETDKLICYDYNTFREEVYDEPEQDLIIGTCLHFAHYYNKDGSGLGRLLDPLKRRIPLPQYGNKNLYTLGFIDKELTEMKSVEDEIIVLPEIKSKGKTKWYIVGEYKYLNPGDTYITKFSTVIRAV